MGGAVKGGGLKGGSLHSSDVARLTSSGCSSVPQLHLWSPGPPLWAPSPPPHVFLATHAHAKQIESGNVHPPQGGPFAAHVASMRKPFRKKIFAYFFGPPKVPTEHGGNMWKTRTQGERTLVRWTMTMTVMKHGDFQLHFFPENNGTHTVEQEKDLFSKSKYQLENASGNSENRDLQLPPAPATQRL